MSFTLVNLGTLIARTDETKIDRVTKELEKMGLDVKRIEREVILSSGLEIGEMRRIPGMSPLYLVSVCFQFGKATDKDALYLVRALPKNRTKKSTKKPARKPARK